MQNININKYNMLRTSSENTIKKNNINDAIAKGKIEGIERIKEMIGESVSNRDNDEYLKIKESIDRYVRETYIIPGYGERYSLKKEYRGYLIDGDKLLFDKEKLTSLEEKKKYYKMNYLYRLPIHEEVVREFPFKKYMKDYTYIYISMKVPFSLENDIDYIIDLLLSHYKDLVFSMEYHSGLHSWEDDKIEFLSDRILVFNKVEDVDKLIYRIKNDLFELIKDNNKLKEESKNYILNAYILNAHLVELKEEKEILNFYNRELLFDMYPIDKYAHVFNYRRVYIYEYKKDLLGLYYLSTSNDIFADVAGNNFLNSVALMNDYIKEHYEKINKISEYQDKLISLKEEVRDWKDGYRYLKHLVVIPETFEKEYDHSIELVESEESCEYFLFSGLCMDEESVEKGKSND
jgi:hypothetical protein